MTDHTNTKSSDTLRWVMIVALVLVAFFGAYRFASARSGGPAGVAVRRGPSEGSRRPQYRSGPRREGGRARPRLKSRRVHGGRPLSERARCDDIGPGAQVGGLPSQQADSGQTMPPAEVGTRMEERRE